MARYDVYLEVGPGGVCLAHLLALPGCIARASNRDGAAQALPGAIRDYHAWLRRHGEDVGEPPAPVALRIAEVSGGFGPFERGDRAALFAPDRAPLGRDELEGFLRRAGYSRADLLALVRGLRDAALDRRADGGAMSVREILRHVGNTEEWYVSRIVEPETLPPEWADDAALPLFDFLAMERRTVAGRLRRLTDRELAEVRYPTRWTAHPDEPWTARKALRRLLEHEREHLGQIRELLDARPTAGR